MIAYLYGKVFEVNDTKLVLMVNGVGYELECTTQLLSDAVIGKERGVYTYLQVREDGVSLYGFDSREEKRLFEKLISVSGVGPKMGISILSGASIQDIITAIASSDVKFLSKIKGLGKKTAERIIIELREKFGGTQDLVSIIGDVGVGTVQFTNEENDAVMALTGLGFQTVEAKNAVVAAKKNGANSVEEIISMALRSLGR